MFELEIYRAEYIFDVFNFENYEAMCNFIDKYASHYIAQHSDMIDFYKSPVFKFKWVD